MNTKQITVKRQDSSFTFEVPVSATRADIKAQFESEVWKRYGEEVEWEETREDAIARMKKARGK